MGSMFSMPKTTTKSNLSPEQEALLGPLGSYLGGLIGQESPGVADLTALLQGQSPLISSSIDSLTNSLVQSSLRSFNQDIAPQIEGGFANIGGTMSSRRGKTLGDSLTRVSLDAQDKVAQLIPSLIQTTMGGIGQREGLRYLPTQQALSFALQPTRQVAQQPGGPGWGLLGELIGAGGFITGMSMNPAGEK